MLSLDRQNTLRDRYRALSPGWRPATEVFADTVRDALSADALLLDLGCGRGGLVEQLETHPLPQMIGIDPDWLSLREHRLGIPRVAGLGRLPFADASFDVVYASWVLEHWEDPARELAEIGRILKPNGVFVFITPNQHNYLIQLNRVLGALETVQKRLVRVLYGRAEDDTFPVWYRANDVAAVERMATASGLQLASLRTIADPTYLAFTPLLFRVLVGVERWISAERRLHLVGILQRS